MKNKTITIEATINAPVNKVWDLWNNPGHITKWAFASEEWHSPSAENDLQVGGKFNTRMEAKDGSYGFDFTGSYNEVITNEVIAYTMDDGRKTRIEFIDQGEITKIIESFDAENENPVEMQKSGWQSILNNFKKYVESSL